MVMFGHSYLLETMSRAADAHSSPRRKFGLEFSLGWLEKRAAMAQTERTRTGGARQLYKKNQNISKKQCLGRGCPR